MAGAGGSIVAARVGLRRGVDGMDDFGSRTQHETLPPFFVHFLAYFSARVSHEGQSCSILFTVNGFGSLLGGLNLVHCQLVQ